MIIEVKNVNPNKLHSELITANLAPLLVQNDLVQGGNIAVNTWLTYPDDADTQAIQVVINAHDPTPLPPQPTQDDYLLDLDYRLSMIELGL